MNILHNNTRSSDHRSFYGRFHKSDTNFPKEAIVPITEACRCRKSSYASLYASIASSLALIDIAHVSNVEYSKTMKIIAKSEEISKVFMK